MQNIIPSLSCGYVYIITESFLVKEMIPLPHNPIHKHQMICPLNPIQKHQLTIINS